METLKRRSARHHRKRSLYYEPETDEEDVELLGQLDSDDDTAWGIDSFPARRAPKRLKTGERKVKPKTRSQSHKAAASRNKGKVTAAKKRRTRELGTAPGKKEKKDVGFVGPSDGIIPAWTSLPLAILRDIFVFASQPGPGQVASETWGSRMTWLLRAARTCRAFALPALEAFYQAPALRTRAQPHHLLELVRIPERDSFINYKVKVKRLEIDFRLLDSSRKSTFDLSALVKELPRLQHLEITHPDDEPPYRPCKYPRWTYPANLFDTLESSGIRLKSWRWQTLFMSTKMRSDQHDEINMRLNQGEGFPYLERLVMCGFDATFDGENWRPGGKNVVTAAMSRMPFLKDLSFVSCQVFEDEVFPRSVERLEITHCDIEADGLLLLLESRGARLRELVLNHNQDLDMSFLVSLKRVCPQLEVLKVNVTVYSESDHFDDAPCYDELLSTEHIPTWPTTLRHLELGNLMRWNADAARNLFSSLVDSAEHLPDLRHLFLQAHIGIPWRDRAGFRDHWVELLQRVFLRRSTEPLPHMGSLRQYQLWKETHPAHRGSVDSHPAHPIPMQRKASSPSTHDTDLSSEAAHPLPPRRSVRVASTRAARATPTDEGPPPSTASERPSTRDQPDPAGLHIQGLCTVVDVRIDNQRPRENQYTEAHFWDSEPSGDEDWVDGAVLEDRTHAW